MNIKPVRYATLHRMNLENMCTPFWSIPFHFCMLTLILECQYCTFFWKLLYVTNWYTSSVRRDVRKWWNFVCVIWDSCKCVQVILEPQKRRGQHLTVPSTGCGYERILTSFFGFQGCWRNGDVRQLDVTIGEQ